MSKEARFFLGIAVIILIGAGISFYHGSMTGRWHEFRGLSDARKVLRELPMEIGDWISEQDDVLPSSEVAMLQIQDGYISRAYRNTKTRLLVHLVIMVGPTGRIVVHTPEICFGGKDFTKEQERVSASIPVSSLDGAREMDDSFWKVDFTNRSVDLNSRISFYYGVSVGDSWMASEQPRLMFQSYRYVYKLQAQAYSEAELDTVRQFLDEALPTIHQYMRPCR